ncbi:hypothetical protein BXZ70DRAFT_1081071 [Cristinia sonorae]|uniref:Uncharacterized protein n=1 Tax=Cristinia sonorae TaxID=1940300 RepID=A0A8K0UEG4_9AGAR|nr:hypothetical protein BXZ70DRAFT_1081071 [Cristinia sonorae]
MCFVFLARYQMEFAESAALEKSSKGQSFITRLVFTGEKGAERLTLSVYLDIQNPSNRFFRYAPFKCHLWTEGAQFHKGGKTTMLTDHQYKVVMEMLEEMKEEVDKEEEVKEDQDEENKKDEDYDNT